MTEKILVVEDDDSMRELLCQHLERRGYETRDYSTVAAALANLTTDAPDLVVTDINLPGEDGLAFCARVREADPSIPVVTITAFGTLDTAVAAIRAGAYDFLTKPFEMQALELVVERGLNHRKLTTELDALRTRVRELDEVTGLVGNSKPILAVKRLISRVAASRANVLIQGESGTGKEVAAREIHRLSKKFPGPLVGVNLAALPPNLLEGELFGHTKGAFTDAKESRRGLFLEADGGTLLLDEIGELPLPLQPKLLRTLEEHKVRSLGANTETSFDARVIACTNRDLATAVAEGHFREDLLYRLNVVEIEMPPLRARGRDILLLAQMFIERFVRESELPTLEIGPEAARKLLAYPWPGNVRELRNCMEYAVSLTQSSRIGVGDLPTRVCEYTSEHVVVAADNPDDFVTLAEVERRYILRTLKAVAGNKTRAARILGLGRKTLYRKLEEYERSADQDG